MTPLLQRLQSGSVVVGDGAWGTMLFARGLRAGEPPESFNLTRPDVLEEIGRLYVEAGAELLTTNTFGGSPLRLRPYGLEDQIDPINTGAVECARRAAAGRAWVSASIGPSGRLLKPYGDTSAEEIAGGFARQIRVLAAAGADLLCIETMTDLEEAVLALTAARRVAPGLPVMATMTFDPTPRGYFTVMGQSVPQAVERLTAAGAVVLGSNCGHGVETMVGIAREFRSHTALPLAIQANAGLPVSRAGELVYPETPDFVAANVPALLDAGVRLIGGCCGTTPAHIRAIRDRVDAATSAQSPKTTPKAGCDRTAEEDPCR